MHKILFFFFNEGSKKKIYILKLVMSVILGAFLIINYISVWFKKGNFAYFYIKVTCYLILLTKLIFKNINAVKCSN